MFSELLPKFLRLKDEEVLPAVLQSIVDSMEAEYTTQQALIDDLKKLIDPDNTEYPKYLLSLVDGTKFAYNDIVEWITKNVVYLHKIKGTEESWKKYWYWLLNKTNVSVVELYKTERHETHDWELEDLTHTIKSSKIQLCILSCETAEETLEDSWEEDYFELIEEVAPVHVRLRPNVNSSDLSGEVDFPYDDLGCISCETDCESDCESGLETWEGSSVVGELLDTVASMEDTIGIEVVCIGTCEMSCEGCCETSCECDSCELFCETGCEANTTHGPGAGGNANCIKTCETDCQDDCESLCTTDCESDCQYTCESECQDMDCQQGSCQLACTAVSGCQNTCEDGCQDGYCTTGGGCQVDT